MTARALLVLVGTAAITASIAVPLGTGAESASRIIDRTVVCQTAGVGYPDVVRFMNVSAEPGSAARDAGPRAFIGNPAGGESGVSAAVSTRSAFGPLAAGGLWLSRCQRSPIRVRLSGSGLQGGPTDPFGASYRCNIPAKIVIRVRGVFKRPTALARDPRSPSVDVAKGEVATGYIAVVTERGRKPVVFASVHDATGVARLFVARSRCRGP